MTRRARLRSIDEKLDTLFKKTKENFDCLEFLLDNIETKLDRLSARHNPLVRSVSGKGIAFYSRGETDPLR